MPPSTREQLRAPAPSGRGELTDQPASPSAAAGNQPVTNLLYCGGQKDKIAIYGYRRIPGARVVAHVDSPPPKIYQKKGRKEKSIREKEKIFSSLKMFSGISGILLLSKYAPAPLTIKNQIKVH